MCLLGSFAGAKHLMINGSKNDHFRGNLHSTPDMQDTFKLQTSKLFIWHNHKVHGAEENNTLGK